MHGYARLVGVQPRLRAPLPLLAATGAAAAAFLGALAVMSAIAGWTRVTSQFRPHLSLWFAAAFGLELVAFYAYVLAYRSVAAVEDGPQLTLTEAAELVAVGFGAFLAKGGATLDSAALRRGPGGEHEGEVRVMALDALEHAAPPSTGRATSCACGRACDRSGPRRRSPVS